MEDFVRDGRFVKIFNSCLEECVSEVTATASKPAPLSMSCYDNCLINKNYHILGSSGKESDWEQIKQECRIQCQ